MDISNLSFGGTIKAANQVDSNIKEATQKLNGVAEGEQPNAQSKHPETVKLLKDNTISLSHSERTAESGKLLSALYKFEDAKSSIVPQYKESLDQIKKVEPSLLGKDWDLGVNSENELLIFTGDDGLSSNEIQALVDAFDNEEFKGGVRAMQDQLVSMSDISYQVNRNSGFAGHYNLTDENINDVYRARETMDSAINNRAGAEYNIMEDLSTQLLARGNDFLKSETENLRFVEVDI